MATRGRESARVKQTAKRFKGYYCDRKGITITQNRVRDIKRPCNDIIGRVVDSQFAHAHSLKIEVDLAWYNRWHSFLAHASLRVRNSPIISNQGDFCLIATYQGEIQQAHYQQNVPLHDHSTYYYVVCVSCDSAVQPEPHPQSCDWLTLQAKRPRSALRN